jgi:hypothetical protein
MKTTFKDVIAWRLLGFDVVETRTMLLQLLVLDVGQKARLEQISCTL